MNRKCLGKSDQSECKRIMGKLIHLPANDEPLHLECEGGKETECDEQPEIRCISERHMRHVFRCFIHNRSNSRMLFFVFFLLFVCLQQLILDIARNLGVFGKFHGIGGTSAGD